MAYHDNLAYQYDYAPAYDPMFDGGRKQQTAVRKKPQTKTRSKAKAAPKHRFSTFLMCAVIAFGAFAILFRALSITVSTNEITKKEKQLTDLQAANQQVSLEIDRSLDLKKVEEVATTKLGMRRPEKFQTVYVNLEKCDYVERTAKDSGGLLNKISGFFSGLFH